MAWPGGGGEKSLAEACLFLHPPPQIRHFSKLRHCRESVRLHMDKEAQLRAMREERTNSVAKATNLVARETKTVSNATDNVAPKTTIVAVIDDETITVADMEDAFDEAVAEMDQLKARIALLEAELQSRKPKALSATERSRKWRRKKA
jgi:dGTP triphosphohydrolase